MRKYIISLAIIILLFTSFYNSHTIRHSKFIIKNGLSYNTKQEAVENRLDKSFVEFELIYENQLDPNHYIVVYYNDSEDFLCAASIEEKDSFFYWEKLTPYFSLENAVIANNKGAYAIYPVVVNDEEINICLGIINDETKIMSNIYTHIINDKFFVILSRDEIKVELS